MADNSTKSLLLDLVKTHSSTTVRRRGDDEDDEDTQKLEVNDIIKGKGKGLVVLLYGKMALVSSHRSILTDHRATWSR